MFSLSATVGYAIQALACLEGGRCSTRYVRDVARCAGIPTAYTAKIFRRLAEAGIVEATRGPNGGTRISRPAREITLLEIVHAVEPDKPRRVCLLGMAECSDERACPAHGFWKKMRGRIERELAGKTLADAIEFERPRANEAGRKKKTRNCCSS